MPLTPDVITITYTNWKGIKAKRLIRPVEIWFGRTEYHPETQWLLKAIDIDKGAERNFAMKDIENWSKN
jgi:hypothetical protein